MTTEARIACLSAFAPSPGFRVDEAQGVIYGASVITAGPAHGGNFDGEITPAMLAAIAASINAQGGVRVRFSHPERQAFAGSPSPDDILFRVGVCKNARVEGQRVRADVYLGDYARVSPHGDLRSYLLALAKETPDQIGLSAAFYLEDMTVKAVDFVGDPAANPTGLLAQNTHDGEKTMTDSNANPDVVATTDSQAPDAEKKTGAPAEMASGAPAAAETEADLIPGADEMEEAFVERFCNDEKMRAKYADGAERIAKAKQIFAEAKRPSSDQPPALTPSSATAVPTLAAGDAEKARLATLAEDKRRREQIAALGARENMPPAWTQQLADRGVSFQDYAALVQLAKEQAPMPANVTVGEDRNLATLAADMSDSLSLRARMPVEKPSERARKLANLSMVEAGRRFLCSLGIDADNMSRAEVARVCFSRQEIARRSGLATLAIGTSDFPYLLANTLAKKLRASYDLAPSTWRTWCSEVTVPDYKTQNAMILSSAPGLLEVKEGAEFLLGAMTEGREQFALVKYGRRLAFTREMFINDDLNAFMRVAAQMGMKAKYLEDVLAYSVLTANGNLADGHPLFDSTHHGNVVMGVINVSNMDAAYQKMRVQKDLDGSTLLNITPAVLIVPAAKENTAWQFVNSKVDPAYSNETPNPFNGRLKVVSSPHLDATSTVAWYLAADPALVDTVQLAFLEGEREPVVEEEDVFNNDTREFKVRHSAAAKALDYRGLVYSTGS